jgi:hypothetical protein
METSIRSEVCWAIRTASDTKVVMVVTISQVDKKKQKRTEQEWGASSDCPSLA